MKTQIKWEVASVKTYKELNGKQNVVSQVQWQVTASNGELNGSVYGSQDLNIDDLNFVPYEQLTEDVMLGWVKAVMGNDQIATYEDKAMQNMNPIKTNVIEEPTVAPLPWVKKGV